MKDILTIALPKGRILKEATALFDKAGISTKALEDQERRLIFEDKDAGLRFMIIRGHDVPTYVEHGAADIGVAGSDVLLEQKKDLYEPLDLKLGRCRLIVAEPAALKEVDKPTEWTHLKVATKFPGITREYFTKKGIEVEIIKLYGSIEIAPILGLSERIVDLVETGETLKQNGLVEVETIMEITSRLVCNRASLKTKPKKIKQFIETLSAVIK